MKSSLASVFLALALLGAGCFQPQQATPQPVEPQQPVMEEPERQPAMELEQPADQPAAMETPQPVVTPTPVPAPTVEPEVKPVTRTVNMTAKQWVFEPARVIVNQGDTVVLNITSVDVDHGFSLSAFGVNVKLAPNTTETVTFVADKKGSFTFSCNVFCGSGHGSMKGTLVVE